MRAILALAIGLTAAALAPSGLAETERLAAVPGVARETPECFNMALGRVDCVVRDKAGRLIWTSYSRGAWSKPKVLTGRMAGPASCVVRGPGGMNCFAVRIDGALTHVAMNGGVWSQPRTLGGLALAGRPSCVAPGRDQIFCFARTRRGGLALKAWNGDAIWQPWRELGGALASDPSCVRLGFGRAACFWRRRDGLLSAWLPVETGPGGAVLSFPRALGVPNCTSLGGEQAVCVGRDAQNRLAEWRGPATLGLAGPDGFRAAVPATLSDPACATARGRATCAVVNPAQNSIKILTATTQGWREAMAAIPAASAARCLAFDTQRDLCAAATQSGELRAVFPGEPAASAPPPALPPPVPPVAAAAPPAAAAAAVAAAPALAIAPASVRDPIGRWHVFEPRTGLHCVITLFDAPARPYRSLTRDADCAALQSMGGVDRWSAERSGLFLRDRRGRVFFRFFEAGPTALRAQWRRRDMVMLARDPRAFQKTPSDAAAEPKPQPESPASDSRPPLTLRDAVGAWQLTGDGVAACTVRLAVDPDTALGLARPQGCRGRAALIDSWELNGGVLILTAEGRTLARLSWREGGVWRGRDRDALGAVRLSRP